MNAVPFETAALLAAGNKLNQLVIDAQRILARYVVPDDNDAEAAINDLLGLLDGPQQREAQKEWAMAAEGARKECG